MKFRNFLLFLILLPSIIGCNDSRGLFEDSPVRPQATSTSNIQRSSEEAIQIAKQFFHEDNPSTRSPQQTSYSVEGRTHSINVRSERRYNSVDTTMFYVNRGRNEGFVIVSGDKRIPYPIIGFAKEGSFHHEDVEENSNLQTYIITYEKYISFVHDAKTLAYDKHMRDSLGSRWQFKLIPLHPDSLKLPGSPTLSHDYPKSYTYYHSINNSESIKWGQKAPYNGLFNPINGNRPPAGCVVTAISQLCAINNQPQVIDNNILRWKDIHAACNPSGKLSESNSPLNKNYREWRNAINDVQHLYSKIALLSGTKYTSKGGITEVDSIPTTLRKLGYSCSKDHAINGEELVTELDNNNPIILTGSSRERNATHAWLVDGYCRYSREYYVEHTAEYLILDIEWEYYFHCNWGWDGRGVNGKNGNGYFSLAHLAPWFQQQDGNWKQSFNFNYWMGCFTNIKYIGHE